MLDTPVGRLPDEMWQMLAEIHGMLPGSATDLQHLAHVGEMARENLMDRPLVVLAGL